MLKQIFLNKNAKNDDDEFKLIKASKLFDRIQQCDTINEKNRKVEVNRLIKFNMENIQKQLQCVYCFPQEYKNKQFISIHLLLHYPSNFNYPQKYAITDNYEKSCKDNVEDIKKELKIHIKKAGYDCTFMKESCKDGTERNYLKIIIFLQ